MLRVWLRFSASETPKGIAGCLESEWTEAGVWHGKSDCGIIIVRLGASPYRRGMLLCRE